MSSLGQPIPGTQLVFYVYTSSVKSLQKNLECIINNKNGYDLWDMVHICVPAQNPGKILLVLSK